MKEIIKNNDMNKNLPLGAENDPRAPWNEPEPKLIDLEVGIMVIIAKKMAIKVEEGYTNSQLSNVLREYADTQFSKEKNDWEIMDIDYKVIRY